MKLFRHSQFSKIAGAFVVCASLCVPLLTGCGGGNSAVLEGKVAELTAENNALKAKLAALEKAQPAPADGAGTSEPVAAAAGAPAHHFIDLEEVPAADMVRDLDKLNVFGVTGDLFKPNEPITRAQYVTWLYKAYNAEEPAAKRMRLAPQLAQVFKDVPPDHPSYKYVQAVSNAGYSIGYKDGSFRPDNPLTREEMLGIKVGVDVGKDLNPWRSQMDTVWKFSDGKDVDERFTGYVHQDFYVSGPNGSNIQRAFGKIGTFRPKQAVTRAEAAATLWQFGQFGETQRTNAAEAGKSDQG